MLAPTDRSMPPEMMINVIPSAAVPTTAVWRSISSMLPGVANRWAPGTTFTSTANSRYTKISPMNGPSFAIAADQSTRRRWSVGER
jgi:hypothetical protein